MATEENSQESSVHKLRSPESGSGDMVDMMFAKRGCCCGNWLPSWERIRDNYNNDQDQDGRWWSKGISVFKKIREWSELVAGPKWKTFIRKFNKKGGNQYHQGKKFKYDPLDYARNFDEGRMNGNFDDDFSYPDFSSRYASIPNSCKSSMDLGKDGPSFT
ncbi:hypothetical protein MKW98_019778 [Papaver atlanticum]|uniref:Uncharacterized protein n=1 Tax=Papaver atlanticum TaxID=357466 RepID=A0AAD4TFS0_9MAGN|nr:hypothetical protein MKW98_019778 [Papaver atlanticum]